MNEWLAAFWFFLPAGFSNMAPVLANKIPLLNRWDTPLDFGKTFKGTRLFGDNKRWRGVVFGTAIATAVGLLQYRVLGAAESSDLIIAAGAMGFGALIGDAVESLFKRRRGIPSGEKWIPFDQTDFIIGGLLFAALVVDITLADVVRILIIYVGLHFAVSYIGYLFGFKEKPV